MLFWQNLNVSSKTTSWSLIFYFRSLNRQCSSCRKPFSILNLEYIFSTKNSINRFSQKLHCRMFCLVFRIGFSSKITAGFIPSRTNFLVHFFAKYSSWFLSADTWWNEFAKILFCFRIFVRILKQYFSQDYVFFFSVEDSIDSVFFENFLMEKQSFCSLRRRLYWLETAILLLSL